MQDHSKNGPKQAKVRIFENTQNLSARNCSAIGPENFIGGIFEGRDLNSAISEFEPKIQSFLHAVQKISSEAYLKAGT